MKQEIDNIKEDIKDIKENHLFHIEADINKIKVCIAGIKTNQDWLMRFFWLIATSSVGSLVIGILNLL